MQSTPSVDVAPHLACRRYPILTGIMLIGILLLSVTSRPSEPRAARWPIDDQLYGLDGWSVGPEQLEEANGTAYVTRSYEHAGDPVAMLVLSTSPEAKRVYRAGAEVPFLGSGFSVDQARGSSETAEYHSMLLTQAGVPTLMLYQYGERRGLLGNGVAGWALALGDALLARPNDYYLVRIVMPLPRPDAPAAEDARRLAEALFPAIAAWYAR